MKLCRVGVAGKEKPCLIDSKNNFRDVSRLIKDFDQSLNFNSLAALEKINLEEFEIIDSKTRLGPCVIIPQNL